MTPRCPTPTWRRCVRSIVSTRAASACSTSACTARRSRCRRRACCGSSRTTTASPRASSRGCSISMRATSAGCSRRSSRKRLVRAQRSPADARQSVLTLTAAGRRAFAPMDAHSQAQVNALLAPLDEPNRRRLLHATGTIESLLGAPRDDRAPYLLRAPQPGDIGWVVARHGAIYAHEYGWDLTFEGLVASIAGRFVERFDAKREACWIAERDGQNVGCVFLVQARDEQDRRARARCRAVAVAARRAVSARPGHRRAAGGRMRAFCAPGRLSTHQAVDAVHAARRARHLCQGWLSAGRQRAAPQFWCRPRRRGVGARAVMSP